MLNSLRLNGRLFFVLLFVAYVGYGLFGHDPWKPDEAYTWGLVYHIIMTGDVTIPHLGGEPLMEKPPLFFATAAGSARLFSPWLALHDGGRVASGFYVGLTALFTWLAARELWGKPQGRLGVYFLIGCFGLLATSHLMVTDTALLAGHAVALYGLSLSLRRPVLSGVMIGSGVGIGFMSKGLLCPGFIGLSALLLPLLFRPWRTRTYVTSLAIALAFALPWLLAWPIAVFQRSPDLFWDWFWINNLGRYFGFAHLGPRNAPGFYLMTLLWYGMPAWPFAAYAVWRNRRGLREDPRIQLPLVVFAVMLSTLSLASDGQSLYALPMLLPLSLLACAGLSLTSDRMRFVLRKWVSGVFNLIVIALWLVWAVVVTDLPAGIANTILGRFFDYSAGISSTLVVLAALVTLGWFAVAADKRFGPEDTLRTWVAGLVAAWGISMTLWLPWIDHHKSYRSLVFDLKRHLPGSYDCIESTDLSDAQRAMLEYFVGITTQRTESTVNPECRFLLVNVTAGSIVSPDSRWQLTWEGRRPGTRIERLRLYEKREGGGCASPIAASGAAAIEVGMSGPDEATPAVCGVGGA